MANHALLNVLVFILITGTLATSVWTFVVLSARPARRSTYVPVGRGRYARAA